MAIRPHRTNSESLADSVKYAVPVVGGLVALKEGVVGIHDAISAEQYTDNVLHAAAAIAISATIATGAHWYEQHSRGKHLDK